MLFFNMFLPIFWGAEANTPGYEATRMVLRPKHGPPIRAFCREILGASYRVKGGRMLTKEVKRLLDLIAAILARKLARERAKQQPAG